MFSIVIPLFNKAHIIERTIQSALNQTFSEFEVIIVDDGSTDGGVALVRQLTVDTRIRVITQKNQGVSAARNKGIKESKFDYIAFLDGDDEWLPDFLLKIKEAIEKFPDAGLYGTSSIHKNIITGESKDATVDKYRNKIEQVDCFQKPNLLPHTSAIVAKKKALFNLDNDYNVFPIGMRVCEDWSCFHRIVLINSLVYIGEPLGIRNNNLEGQVTGQVNVTNNLLHERWLDGVKYYNLVYDYWLSNKMKNKYFLSFIQYNLRHNIKCFAKDDNWDVIELITRNLKKGIFNKNELKLYNKRAKLLSIVFINGSKIYCKLFNR